MMKSVRAPGRQRESWDKVPVRPLGVWARAPVRPSAVLGRESLGLPEASVATAQVVAATVAAKVVTA